MDNFRYWHDEIADMPTKAADGTWYDMETGIPFSDHQRPRAEKKKFVSTDETDIARNYAKTFGGKALTGTAKQKLWGEKIRHSILQAVSKDQAEILCQHKMFYSAKFWIENRSLQPTKIGQLAEEVLAHTKEANRLLDWAERAIVIGPGNIIVEGQAEHYELMRLRQIALNKMETVFLNA